MSLLNKGFIVDEVYIR